MTPWGLNCWPYSIEEHTKPKNLENALNKLENIEEKRKLERKRLEMYHQIATHKKLKPYGWTTAQPPKEALSQKILRSSAGDRKRPGSPEALLAGVFGVLRRRPGLANFW